MVEPERGRGSGGELCWRATRQGLPGWNSSHRWAGEGSSWLLPGFSRCIGTIDSLMPEKTHAWSRCRCRLAKQALFELLRRAVVERRVQSSAIVIALDELADVSLQSEERRVGKECRSRWSPSHRKKKDTKRRTIHRQTEKIKTSSEAAEAYLTA